jgi:hypothetical protein
MEPVAQTLPFHRDRQPVSQVPGKPNENHRLITKRNVIGHE